MSTLFLLGGDDYTNSHGQLQGVVGEAPPSQANYNPYEPLRSPWGWGGFQNDVWVSTGVDYTVYADWLPPAGTMAGMPRFVSTMAWQRAGAAAVLPPLASVNGTSGFVDYRDWLCCLPAANWPCSNDTLCANPAFAVTPTNRRWSPRRGHAAVSVLTAGGGRVLVMGGRARELARLPPSMRVGGMMDNLPGPLPVPPGGTPTPTPTPMYVNDPVDGRDVLLAPSPMSWPTIEAHERAVLTSDVWSTEDGEAWTLVHPGCYALQDSHSRRPGRRGLRCATTGDCVANRLGDATCVAGLCVCRAWSPRERFAVATDGTSVVLAGGVTYTQPSLCGDVACGSEFPTLLNDVWRSPDGGASWVLLTPMAPWRPRADSALVYVGATRTWWLLAGRGSHGGDALDNPLLADTWYSTNDAAGWVQNDTAAPFGPRAGHVALVDDTRIVVLGGQVPATPTPVPPMPDPATAAELAAHATITNIYRPRVTATPAPPPGVPALGSYFATAADVWSLETVDRANASVVAAASTAAAAAGLRILLPTRNDSLVRPWNVWVRDYSLPAWPAVYIDVDGDALGQVPGLTPDGAAALAEWGGVTTLRQLATALDAAVVARMQDPDDLNLPGVCEYVRAAQARLGRCDITHRPAADEFMRTIVFVPTLGSAPEPERDDGCTGVPAPPLATYDLPCRQRWTPRAMAGAAVMDGIVYTAGGYEAANDAAADVWYRDERSPSTLITSSPHDMSDEFLFTFACDEPYCIFEYRVVDDATERTILEWRRTMATLDVYGVNGDERKSRLYVRAIDPAGNRDEAFEVGRNVYIWAYKPPFPLLLVVLLVVGFLLLCCIGLEWYRRCRRRAALERYMRMRRMRKLKHRAKGTLGEYDQQLIKQFVPPPPEEKKEEEEPIVKGPRFDFGNRLGPVAASVGVERAPPPEVATKAPVLDANAARFSYAAPAPEKPKFTPGVPTVVNLTTGAPMPAPAPAPAAGGAPGRAVGQRATLARADRTVLPGMETMGGNRAAAATVRPDPTIRLADNTMVTASQLRVAVSSLAAPPRATAAQLFRQQLAAVGTSAGVGTGAPGAPPRGTQGAGRGAALSPASSIAAPGRPGPGGGGGGGGRATATVTPARPGGRPNAASPPLASPGFSAASPGGRRVAPAPGAR